MITRKQSRRVENRKRRNFEGERFEIESIRFYELDYCCYWHSLDFRIYRVGGQLALELDTQFVYRYWHSLLGHYYVAWCTIRESESIWVRLRTLRYWVCAYCSDRCGNRHGRARKREQYVNRNSVRDQRRCFLLNRWVRDAGGRIGWQAREQVLEVPNVSCRSCSHYYYYWNLVRYRCSLGRDLSCLKK